MGNPAESMIEQCHWLCPE